MENKIPTSEDFLLKHDSDIYAEGPVYSESGYSYSLVRQMLVEFAKLHVEEALKSVTEIERPLRKNDFYHSYRSSNINSYSDDSFNITLDKDSILSSYPLDNIK